MGDISPGREFTVFDYGQERFAVLICFEDVFPVFVSRFSQESTFLINITNDAWFKGEPEAGQHLAIMTFRAIENRRSIVRSANTGISGFVDFRGVQHTFKKDGRRVFVEGVKLLQVPLNYTRSVYNTIGEAFTFLCGCVLLVALVRRRKNYG